MNALITGSTEHEIIRHLRATEKIELKTSPLSNMSKYKLNVVSKPLSSPSFKVNSTQLFKKN